MTCTCPDCGAQFNISDAKIPDKGARIRCVKCKTAFKVQKNKKGRADAPVAAKKQKTASMKDEVQQSPIPPSHESQKSSKFKGNKREDKEVAPEIIKKACSAEVKKGAPPWIITFADLATLMLTFFVLLLSFANMDIIKFRDMLGSVQDAFGVTKQSKGVFQAAVKDVDVDKEPSKPEESAITGRKAKQELERQQMARKIEEVAQNTAKSDNISVSIEEQGVHVRIKGAYFFDPGSAILKKDALPFLDNIAHLMKDFPFKLKVEGHTDNIPISTTHFPSNWELSAVRATTVLRYFVEQNEIESSRLTAIGYAENKPIAPNDEALGRAKNRRVEFIFSK